CILFAARPLEGRVLVWIGLISYTLYLWHWPILKTLQAFLGDPDDWQLALAILFALGLSIATYRFVERPIRYGVSVASNRTLLYLASAMSALLLVVGVNIRTSDGFPARIPDAFLTLQETGPDQRGEGLTCGRPTDIVQQATGLDLFSGDAFAGLHVCAFGDRSRPAVDVLYWGDSHLGAIVPELGARFSGREEHGLMVALPACPPLPDVAWTKSSARAAQLCADLYEEMRTLIQRAKPRRTVLVAHWDTYATEGGQGPGALRPVGGVGPSGDILPVEIERMVSELAEITDLFVLLDVPTHDLDVPDALATSLRWPWLPKPNWVTRQEIEANRQSYLPILISAEGRDALTLLDPFETFCPVEQCLAEIDGVPLFYDHSHVSARGAALLFDGVPQLVGPD
ncbi:MAG: acyltransferase family protein, partial [Pseudomonadota bacterium]